jgi:GNAT superfamily N-acetyltransferase
MLYAMVKVRRARLSDAAALATMNSEFNHVDIDPGWVRASLRHGREIVLVAERGGERAGFACALVNVSFCYDRPWAELTELFVRPGHRRAGCGKALVRAIEMELSRRGVVHVHILTGARNRRARALYEAMGYAHNRAKPEVLYDRNMPVPARRRKA